MQKNTKKFVIIDGNALIHRSFHALPTSLTTKDGMIVNAVYGFTSFILKAFIELKPEFVVLTLDRPAPTFRHEEYADYKATRVKAPDELYEQIPLVKQLAQVLDIPIYEKDGFEADDLIGTLATKSEQETDWQNIIITGDMDTLQLISDRTFVYAMGRGLSESKLYDRQAVQEKYGISPEQVIDYKAIKGDPSDNIPGVKGLGDKGASTLLQQFQNLEGIYEALENNDDQIKERTKKLLTADKESAFLSRRLATIEKNVPLEINWSSFQLNSFDLKKAQELFVHFEFKSLLNKLEQVKNLQQSQDLVITSTPPTKTEIKVILIDDQAKADKFLKQCLKQKEIAFQICVCNVQDKQEIQGIALAWQKDQSYYLPIKNTTDTPNNLFSQISPESANLSFLSYFKQIMENENIAKYGHDLKNTLKICHQYQIFPLNLSFDTLIASYLLHPERHRHLLQNLAIQELSLNINVTIDQDKNKTDDLNTTHQTSSYEAAWIWQLQNVLLNKLKEKKLFPLFQKLELPLIPILNKMEEAGIILDPKPLKKLAIDLNERIKKISNQIYQLAGKEFNINSPKQLQEILFTALQINTKGLKKTKTGISTADDELNKIKDQHEIITLIQSHRELSKLNNTYVLSLPNLISQKDGRIHSTFNQSITATGRLSSTEPNLQNIPTRTPEGRLIRSAFKAKEGYKLLGLDYSQIELRLAAHLSQDKKMIEAFQRGADIHSATAAAINKLALEKIDSTMRRAAKAINFGILYGQGPHGLSQNANISYAEAQAFIQRYFEVYPEIKKMMDQNIKAAYNQGFAETIFHRRRPLPELNSDRPQIRKAAERMAINMPIQGSAADMIKKAMIEIDQLIKHHSDEIQLLLQIHDELIFEVREDKLEQYSKIISQVMSNVITLSVPIVVESASGDNWNDLK